LRFMLYRGFWFPKEVGEFEFGGGDLWVEQQVQGGYRNQLPRFATVELPLPQKNLQVVELPATQLPRAQSVGQFEFSYQLPKESFLTGETIPLTLLVKGNGNISMVPRPFFDPPENFLMYDPNISYTVLIEGEELIGQKEFVFEMVPAFAGRYEIGPAQMYFYHPGRSQYDSLQVEPFSIEITGEDIPQLMEVDALDNYFREGLAQASEEPSRQIPGLKWWFLAGGLVCLAVLIWQLVQLLLPTFKQWRS
ncbi:MAG: BatD family protein, partial [Bacteroidota bacterium]